MKSCYLPSYPLRRCCFPRISRYPHPRHPYPLCFSPPLLPRNSRHLSCCTHDYSRLHPHRSLHRPPYLLTPDYRQTRPRDLGSRKMLPRTSLLLPLPDSSLPGNGANARSPYPPRSPPPPRHTSPGGYWGLHLSLPTLPKPATPARSERKNAPTAPLHCSPGKPARRPNCGRARHS